MLIQNGQGRKIALVRGPGPTEVEIEPAEKTR